MQVTYVKTYLKLLRFTKSVLWRDSGNVYMIRRNYKKYVNQLHGLWNPEVQCRIHKGSPIIHIPSRLNLIPSIDTYL